MEDDKNIQPGDVGNNAADAADVTKAPEEVTEAFNANLQEEIERYQQQMAALQAEFNVATDETSPQATKAALIAAAPTAIQEIISLVSAASESVRLSAAKYILDVALGKSKLEADADGFDALIKQLMSETAEKDAKKNSEKKGA